jgi:hypothetical protein
VSRGRSLQPFLSNGSTSYNVLIFKNKVLLWDDMYLECRTLSSVVAMLDVVICG